MPATPERAEFIRQDYRIVKVADLAVDALYGAWARKTDEPIPTSLEAEADAQAIVNARPDLLNNGRRMSWEIGGEAAGMTINYIGVCPAVQTIDDQRQIDTVARVDEIQIDFSSGKTLLETWG